MTGLIVNEGPPCAHATGMPSVKTIVASKSVMVSPGVAAAPYSTLLGRGSGMGFLLRVLVNILAIVLAASVVPGIRLDGALSAVAAGTLLGVVNAVVRPVLLILTFPITLVTLGLFLFVLNGICLWLVAEVVRGFHVAGFWSAVLGALCVSVVSWIVTALVSDSGKVVVITRRPRS